MTDDQLRATLFKLGAEWLMDDQDEFCNATAIRAVAAAAEALERERCAKLCEEVSREHFSEGMTWESNGSAACAARIRAA